MDVAAALRSLDLSREDDVPSLDWLDASCAEPPSFWADLAAFAMRAQTPAPRSRTGVAVTLYHDLFGRHAPTDRVALRAFDRRAGIVTLTYAEVAKRASVCAWGWAARGLAPGAVIAIALPFGPSWVVALAAALRLGLVVSAVELTRDKTMIARLTALSPARIIVDPASPPPLGPLAEKALGVVEEGLPHSPSPHAYGPKDPCAMILSPVRAPLGVPLPLAAEAAWQTALRDGLFVYRISTGSALALPGFSLQQTQPSALFATAMAGATLVHLSMEDLEDDPTLLSSLPISTLGVTPYLRDLLRKQPIGKLAVEQWCKPVEEPLDWHAWKDFITKAKLEKTMSQNVLLDAASGGAVLFSTRRPGSINAYALPAPGRAYTLADLASGEPTQASFGVFVPKPGDPKKDGWFLLAKRAGEFLWAGTVAPRRHGKVFPATELCALVAEIPGVEGASVVASPTGQAGDNTFTLIVFTGGRRDVSEAAVSAAVEAHLSADHAPDAVVIMPLFPKKKGKEVDAEWVLRQYSAGTLVAKAAHPLFQKLTALRALLVPPAPPAPKP